MHSSINYALGLIGMMWLFHVAFMWGLFAIAGLALFTPAMLCIPLKYSWKIKMFFINIWTRAFLGTFRLVAPSQLQISVDKQGDCSTGEPKGAIASSSDRCINEELLRLFAALQFQEMRDANDIGSAQSGKYILMANHQTKFDWMYLWALLHWIGNAGNLRVILKASLQYVPILGFAMRAYGFVFLKRRWDCDKVAMENRLQRLAKGKSNPLFLMLFPEGTIISEDTHPLSMAFAAKNNLAPTQHVLLPRTTGLHYIVGTMASNLAGIYDVTFWYNGHDDDKTKSGVFLHDIYSILNVLLLRKSPRTIHMHIRYYPSEAIPPVADYDGFSHWLRDIYYQKEVLLDQCKRAGHFVGVTSLKPIPLTTWFDVVFSCVASVSFTWLIVSLFTAWLC